TDWKRLRRPAWLVASVLCVWLAADCARIAAAGHLASSLNDGALHTAIGIWPHRPDYYRSLAVLQPQRAGPWVAPALQRNRRDTHTWLRAGIEAESIGNYPEAERCLLQAVALDKTFEPKWTLCNFYFRHGSEERFWQSARETARIAQQDLTPLFD